MFKSLFGYVLNCFMLLVPIFVWNVVFYDKLPAPFKRNNFWKDIPPWIGTTENIMRIVIFVIPLFLKMGFQNPRQQAGWVVYLVGTGIYFLSWFMLMYFPDSPWSRSMLGFTAAAWASLFWLVGIGLIGQCFFTQFPYHFSIYIILSTIFAAIHTLHAYIVFSRL